MDFQVKPEAFKDRYESYDICWACFFLLPPLHMSRPCIELILDLVDTIESVWYAGKLTMGLNNGLIL